MPSSEPCDATPCVASEFRVEAMVAAAVASLVFAVPAVGMVLLWVFA